MRTLLLLTSLSLLAAPALAGAATFTVNAGNDTNDGACNATHCSLREAINAANATATADIIELAASVSTVQLTGALPTVTRSVTIRAPVHATIDAQATFFRQRRVLNFGDSGRTYSLKQVTLTGGYAPSADGGGVYLASGNTLTVDACTIDDNTGRRGGGIYTGAATLTVLNSTISGNTATVTGGWDGGGGLYLDGAGSGSASLANSSVLDNTAASGGGIQVDRAALSVTNSTIAGNASTAQPDDEEDLYASWGGGGILINGSPSSGGTTVTASTIADNTAMVYGGGIYNRHGRLTVTGTTVSGNLAGPNSIGGWSGGGGIASWRLTTLGATYIADSNIRDNSAQAGEGGGLYLADLCASCPPFDVRGTAIAGNSGVGTFGGGVFVAAGHLIMTRSSMTGHDVDVGHGGGLYLGDYRDDASYQGSAALESVTIADNRAEVGSAIAGDSTRPSHMIASTAAGNQTLTSLGGALQLDDPAAVFPGTSLYPFRDNLIANPASGDDCAVAFGFAASPGLFNSHNLSQDTSCGFTQPDDLEGVDPLLGPLDRGTPAGIVQVRPLLHGSPAIDAAAGAAILDGRGGSAIGPRDLGAYEFGAFGVFELAATAYMVTEGTLFNPPVTRAGGSSSVTASVHAQLNSGVSAAPAELGTDFDYASSALITWGYVTGAGTWAGVHIYPDAPEGYEDFSITLVGRQGSDVGARSSATVMIRP